VTTQQPATPPVAPNQPITAPPQTPGAVMAVARANQQTAVEVAQDVTLISIAGRKGVERFETVVTLPAQFQYEIKRKGSRQADGSWAPDTFKVGITADGYDYLNRVLGASFFLPEWVHDEQGKPQRNPIHRKDYIYLRLGCVWYTPLGQLIMATEDVEVDFNLTWMDARINAYGAEVMTDPETGLPQFDQFGNPAVKLDKAAELKALKTLSQLRTFGPRYAQTVARVRLLKMATGIRSLTSDHPKNTPIKMVGFRDQMSAQQRIETAGGDLGTLYGRADDTTPLTANEMAEVGDVTDDNDITEAIDRDAVAAQQAEPNDRPFSNEDLADSGIR
jgi:hypothetical protein